MLILTKEEIEMGYSNVHRFGEVIPLSKADIAAGTINLENYQALSSDDRKSCANRNYIWKPESASAAIKHGKTRELAWWQNNIRKYISLHPIASRPYEMVTDEDLEKYVKAVTDIRDHVLASTDPGFVTTLIGTMPLTEYVNMTYPYNYPGRYYERLFSRSMYSTSWTMEMIARQVKRERYGYSEEENLQADAEDYILGDIYKGELKGSITRNTANGLYLRDNRGQYSLCQTKGFGVSFYYPEQKSLQNLQPETYMVFSINHTIIASNLSKEDFDNTLAMTRKAYIAARIAANGIHKNNNKETRKKHFVPELVDIKQENGFVNPNKHATSDDYLNTLHFKGGEFGNWLDEDERDLNLDMAFVAFMDLRKVLDITDISFNNYMSIAFGSRGHGNAAAHYEPGITDVINLTKMNGAGCLAHEWGHAFDRHIATMMGYDAGILASEAWEHGKYLNKHQIPHIVENVGKVFYQIRRSPDFVSGSNYFDIMYSKERAGYWSSICEMFARAFDCYIHDKLTAAGITDTYLSGYSDEYCYEGHYAYPRGEERKKINETIDAMMDWFRGIKGEKYE